MAEVRLRPRADADIRAIWTYTSETWSDQQANIYVDALFDMMEALAADPARGRSADEVKPGLRRQSCGSHIIFYRSEKFGADIVRVLHGRMDVLVHLANEQAL